MQRVLILCTGNSCRSQMAEALWKELGQGQWQAESAGSRPAGYVHPLAIRTMSEIGLDISQNTSKSLQLFLSEAFDVVVTVCDHARDSCPVFDSAKQMLHWPFDDPVHAPGSEQQQLLEFRRVRDQIKEKISEYLGVGQ